MISLRYMVLSLSLIFSFSAYGEILNFVGVMKVRDMTVPAKATYEVLSFRPEEPKIEIKYKLSGKDYMSVYMSSFGDKYRLTADTIEVYNNEPDKKQNYSFSGKKASWFEFITN